MCFKRIDKIFSSSIDKLPRAVGKSGAPNREALKLYREVLKVSKYFDWNDPETGEPYGQKIRKSARREFEIAKMEKDPLIVMQMISTSLESIELIKQKVLLQIAILDE